MFFLYEDLCSNFKIYIENKNVNNKLFLINYITKIKELFIYSFENNKYEIIKYAINNINPNIKKNYAIRTKISFI